MPRPTRAVGYRAVLRLPGVPRAFAAAMLGRLSYATISLSLLVTIQHATGSYAVAGTCLGVFALAGVTMPVKSRLIDRCGQRRILPLLSATMAGVLALIVIAADSGVGTRSVYLVLAAATGLAAAPLGPCMRFLWAALAPDPQLRQRAYSLDGVIEEVLYAVGPLLVGGILTFSNARAALLITAGLNLCGTLGMATSPVAVRHGTPAASSPQSWFLGPFRRGGFVVLTVVMLGIGVGGGPLEVVVLARAQEAGQPSVAGYLLAALSIGSATGGMVWGALRHRRRTSTQLGALVMIMAVGAAAATTAPSLPWLSLVLLLTGLVSAPALIVSYLAADDLVPEGGRTEATTWVNTSNNVGIAVGAAAAGVVLDTAGTDIAFLTAAVTLALTAGFVSMARRHLDTPSAASARRPGLQGYGCDDDQPHEAR